MQRIMLSYVLIYCKRSLDFEMKETLKKRIVDINIYISKICYYCHLTFDNEKQKKNGRNTKTSNCPRKTG